MSKISSTYAKALFDVALEENALTAIKDDFNALVSAVKSEPAYMNILIHPKLSNVDKANLINQVLVNSSSKLLNNFLMILIDKNRIDMIVEINLSFNELVNTHLGQVVGVVYTAHELTDEQLQVLTETFAKKLGKEVKLDVVLDASLIGGYKINVDNVVYDNSVKLQLKHLKDTLMNVELK